MNGYEKYREKKSHGDAVFPFNIYPCVIPDMFSEVLTHWHDEMEIIYVKNGAGVISVDFESRICRAPALIFVLPGHTHSIRRLEGDRMVYENIIFHPRLLYSGNTEVFDCEYLKPLFQGQYQIPTFITPEYSGFQELEDIVAELNDERREELRYPLFAKSRLYYLCYCLQKDHVPREESPSRRERRERMKEVLSYVEAHYFEEIRVADVASMVGFSESHFMRSFKEAMGMSFITYLKEYRLSRAEGLLRTTRTSILGVANETGFRNFSYFIRIFKKRYGTTPLQYRTDWEAAEGM